MDARQSLTNILIADDDAPTRMLLRATLSQWGYAVQEAVDGLDAFDKLQKPDAPMLVLVDWMMPRLDGIGFCTRVKKEIANPPYIILLTSFSGTTQIIKALDAGADEFLSKPFNPAELHSRLRAGSRILKYECEIEKSLSPSIDTQRAHLIEISTQLEKSLENFNHNLSSEIIVDEALRKALVNDLQNIKIAQEKLSDIIDSLKPGKES